MYSIRLMRQGEAIACAQGEQEASLLYNGAYAEGDCLEFASDSRHVVVQVDQQIAPARVYAPGCVFTYRLPLSGDNLAVYAPGAFAGDKHLVAIRPAKGNAYRNLAENPADQRGDVAAYPHAMANVETRNESVFAARNTVDGVHAAAGHGEWPYGSWGIGARTDAEMTLDFGREVEIDCAVLYLRADFPHDAWWIQGVLTLDDGTEKVFPLEKMDGPQKIDLGGVHRVQRIKLHRLVKCDMPSAFPALRQIEVYGRDCGMDV